MKSAFTSSLFKGFIMLVAVGSMIFMSSCGQQHKSKDELFKENFKVVPVDNTNRGAETLADDAATAQLQEALSLGMSAYSERRYAEAVKSFEAVLALKPDHTLVPFYLGISQLALDNSDKATEQFTHLLNMPNTLYYEHSQWFMALIYLDKAEYKKCADLLEQIIATKSHPYKENAENMVDQVEYLMQHGKD